MKVEKNDNKVLNIRNMVKQHKLSEILTSMLTNIEPSYRAVRATSFDEINDVNVSSVTHELVGMLDGAAVNLMVRFDNYNGVALPLKSNNLSLNIFADGGQDQYACQTILENPFTRIFDNQKLDDLACELLALSKAVNDQKLDYYDDVERNNELTDFDVCQTTVDGLRFTTTITVRDYIEKEIQSTSRVLYSLVEELAILDTGTPQKLFKAYAQARVNLDTTGTLAKLDTTSKLENFLKLYMDIVHVDSSHVVATLKSFAQSRNNYRFVFKLVDNLPTYVGMTSENCKVKGVHSNKIRDVAAGVRREVNKTLSVIDSLVTF